jgi:hypothetical protein
MRRVILSRADGEGRRNGSPITQTQTKVFDVFASRIAKAFLA